MEEQHAVPQDITGFQFKLVGDMTLKQFGELAFGAIVAYLFFASNWHPFLKWPMVFFFGFLGVALAFIPIEERPLDVWIANFFKAIYKPTYFVWKKGSDDVAILAPTPQLQPWPKPKPEVTPESPPAPKPPILSVDELTKLREQKLAELNVAKQKLAEKTVEVKTETYKAENAANIVTVDKLVEMREKKNPVNDLIRDNTELIKQIEEANAKVDTLSGTDKDILSTKIEALNKQKDILAKSIESLQNQPPTTNAPVAASVQPPWSSGGTGQMRVVDRPVKASPTISLTEIPNIINGTVFDQRNAPMEGVILVIKDKAGNSVRALKTNRIGQFIVSTPLENGTYYLEFEIANYTFNVYEITLDGKVITPLEIRGTFNG